MFTTGKLDQIMTHVWAWCSHGYNMIKSEVKYSPPQPDFNFDRSELNVHQFSSVWIFCMERTALDFVCLYIVVQVQTKIELNN